ncbi:MAG TPA: ABC transporter permease [Candidatus Dormibacteraeota bacterium]|nr:ABC transporter permease [Candidatus Dormibacteraeota bacterium]
MATWTRASATPEAALADLGLPDHAGPWRLALERFLAHRLAVASLAALLLLVVLVLFGPTLSPYNPEHTNLNLRYEPPSPTHLMGTDSLGRDLLTRIMFGGRVSMTIGVLAMTVAITLGVVLGGLAGFYGGVADALLMRFVDMMLSFPRLFLLILFSVFFGGHFLTVVLLLGALSWMGVSRIIRASFLSLKERQFVEAAKALAVPNRVIMTRHLLPNALAPIIVAATLGIATAIIAESTLSFLGLGIQPPTPSWGNMLKDAQTDMSIAPWTAVFPGLAIFVTVVAINFIGDGLRDALDPQHVIRSARR